jgi:hypothetical protein
MVARASSGSSSMQASLQGGAVQQRKQQAHCIQMSGGEWVPQLTESDLNRSTGRMGHGAIQCAVGVDGSAHWLMLPRGSAKGSCIQCCYYCLPNASPHAELRGPKKAEM